MNIDKESEKIRQVFDEYTRKGYRVVLEPRAMPELAGLVPDLVATSPEGQVVVVEVVRAGGEDRREVVKLAERVRELGWTFEIVQIPEQIEGAEVDELKRRLVDAAQILKLGYTGPAILATWAVAEGILRQLLDRESNGSKESRPMTPLQLVKTAFSMGLLSRSTLDLLTRSGTQRNRLAHGLRVDPDVALAKLARELLDVATHLMTRLADPAIGANDVTADEMVTWFFEHYKDPADGVPHDSEDGYIYINGGPYDASDELAEQFPDAPDEVLEDAIGRIIGYGHAWVKIDEY